MLKYTPGNDLSERNFQLPETPGDQFCYAKSFDQLAPIGYAPIRSQEVQGPQQMSLVNQMNCQVKQTTNSIDMIWGVREINGHLSRGMILRNGTVFMTDTPSGVGFFRKEFLQNGDMARVKNTAKYL